MAYIESSDFKGKYKLPQDASNMVINTNVVDQMRDGLIRRIYGATMGNAIIAYIDATLPPANPELDNVINPFSIDVTESQCYCGENSLLESIGLKNVLLGFIYYQRQCDLKLQTQSVGGEVRPKTENSSNDILPQAKLIERYNDSVNSVRAIQARIKQTIEDYPDYNGQNFLLNYIL